MPQGCPGGKQVTGFPGSDKISNALTYPRIETVACEQALKAKAKLRETSLRAKRASERQPPSLADSSLAPQFAFARCTVHESLLTGY